MKETNKLKVVPDDIIRCKYCKWLVKKCDRYFCRITICPTNIIGFCNSAERKVVDAVPVVHGHWIGLEYDGYADGYPVYDLWECSICGNEICGTDAPAYCCDCGAKMDEVE